MVRSGEALSDYQAEFSSFLLQGSSQLQPGLSARLAWRSSSSVFHARRIDLGLQVYRNNVMYSLTQALAAQFPAVNKLVGAEFFAALARDYVRQQPPLDPSLACYGHLFANFIEASAACEPLPYLADVARLELLCQEAFNAADDSLVDLEQLAALPPCQLEDVCMTLKASAFLFSSDYPVDRIWSANLENSAEEIRLEPPRSHHMLVYRRDLQVQVVTLQPAAFSLLQQLQRGQCLGTACMHIQNRRLVEESAFPSLLSYLLTLEVFSHFFTQQAKEIS